MRLCHSFGARVTVSVLVCSPSFPFLHTMAAVYLVNLLCYAGNQAHRRHNIEVLHRAGKSPQEIIQQTGYKKTRQGHFWHGWF